MCINDKSPNNHLKLKKMKTTHFIKLGFLMVAALTFSLSSCKKDKTTEPTPDSGSLQQLSKDQVTVETASDDALNDANEVMSSTAKILPCNVTVTRDTIGDTTHINLAFNGLNCAGTRSRLGNIKVSKLLSTPWSQAGATVKVEFINYKVTKISTGNWVILNGVKTWQNVSGGIIPNLGTTATAIIHKVSGSIQATFNDNTTRTWEIARQKTYTGTYPSGLILSVDGFGVADGYSNLETWGINRHGEQFYTQVLTTVVLKQSCGWDPCAGIIKHSIPSDTKSATITYGFDSSNQPITGTECPSEYKVDWVKGTHSGTLYIVLP